MKMQEDDTDPRARARFRMTARSHVPSAAPELRWTSYAYAFNLRSAVARPSDMQLTFVPPELEAVLSDLNPWWTAPHAVRPQPPAFRRRQTRALLDRLRRPTPLIQVIRGPRQVGKTTAILQMVA